VISEGEEAPGFRLPGVVDGEVREFDLGDYLEESVVVVAFYPGDFNPACTGTESDLDDVDLLTMQDDVAVFGIAPDTVHSHRAFAAEYDLDMTLLSDPYGEVIEEYGFDRESEAGAVIARRAVVVVAHDGTVEYVWSASGDHDTPAVDHVRTAIAEIGDDTTALERYRIGHARYVEGRRSFTSAMSEYEDQDWLMSQTDFEGARDDFQEAADEFATTARFLSVDEVAEVAKRADRKATALWQAAEWLADSTNACASGRGGDGVEFREDAEAPLEAARDIDEPIEPDEFRTRVIRAREAPEETTAAAPETDEGDGDLSDAVAGVVAGDDGDGNTPGGDRSARTNPTAEAGPSGNDTRDEAVTGGHEDPAPPVDEVGDATSREGPDPDEMAGSRYSQSRLDGPVDEDDGDLELELDDPDPDDEASSDDAPSNQSGPAAAAGPDIVPSAPGDPTDEVEEADDAGVVDEDPGTGVDAETTTEGSAGSGTDEDQAGNERSVEDRGDDAIDGEANAGPTDDDGEIVLDLKDPTESNEDDPDEEPS